jgi:GNAT superfamily N-acetyltransferase
MTEKINILKVTAENVSEAGIFCLKNKKNPGYQNKIQWFTQKTNEGLTIQIAVDDQNKQLGFIEYMPSEVAWRPIKANNYLFIQCIVLFVKEAKHKGIGSALIKSCEQEAKQKNKDGICIMSSDGTWMADKSLFEKNGFAMASRLDRFELMYKKLSDKSTIPQFNDWTKQQAQYKGWNLIYSDQCPLHDKSVTDLLKSAQANGIKLNVKKLSSPHEAQNAPSGFGTYTLIKDGKLLSDHYISKTRFENILKKEM